MGKRKYEWNERKIKRFQKEGRGKGAGESYKPWLTVRDLSSVGRSIRVPGRVVDRIHHLLSDHERRAFLVYDYADSVSDIREQYPLDREETKAIAKEAGIVHPADSDCLLVQTTDLLVTLLDQDGGKINLARSIKPAEHLRDQRTLEKLELERRYWERHGVDWRMSYG
jgi:hypothetical protein